MQASDFTEDAPGDLVRNMSGDLAFVPRTLPPTVNWTNDVVVAMNEAESALGKLSGIGKRFPQPERLIRLFLRREAELSSRIENTFAGVRTQLLFHFVSKVRMKAPDVQEVDNNFRALRFGLKAIESRPVSQSLIREMHQVLLRNVRGQDETPGVYRKVQAHIGRSANIQEARFVPAPPHLVPDCMENLERFIRENVEVPRLARLAMIHYQFEAIHPFADGNGRIGRVLILLMMCQTGLLPLPLFNPSASLEADRSKYYDHLLNVSQRGTWGPWIAFFARGVTAECGHATRRIEALEKLRLRYQKKIRTSRTSAKLTQLVDELFGQPRVILEDVQKMLDVWPQSAQRFIDRLIDLKILREVSGAKRNRVYLAHEIVGLFETGDPRDH
ncbi:MAG TPA: Fic family protein [Tepidisphaeraceae bacterium]|jgi:Fic family protein|nr:Fic family protein [Tepidisphaeraceae bacterium]